MACLPIISKDGCCIGFSHILSINTPTRLLCQIIQNPESEKENWWRYFIKISGAEADISKSVRGEHYELTRKDRYQEYNTWHTVKLICRGNQIKVYISGELVTEYIDDDPLKNG
jgi:hypothetical protein